jgi:hypothetical protein
MGSEPTAFTRSLRGSGWRAVTSPWVRNDGYSQDPLRGSGCRAVTFPWVRNPRLFTRSPAGIGWRAVTFPWVHNPQKFTRSPAGIGMRFLPFPWVRNPRLFTRSPAGIGMARRHVSVGSEPTAIHKIPCGDRDGAPYHFREVATHGYSQDPLRGSECRAVPFPWVRNPRLFTRSPAGIGMARRHVSVGSEPTAIHKISCGDRDGAHDIFRGFSWVATDCSSLAWFVGGT